MTSKLIVANWKMNGSREKALSDLSAYANNPITNKMNIIFALPSLYLSVASSIDAKFCLACQDVSQFTGSGAFTGEISAAMLKEFNVKYTIIGHSERRNLLNESGSILHKKLENALQVGIIPIFCIGEDKLIRSSGNYLNFLLEQLEILNQLDDKLDELVIAYEPIWSIGTGIVPTLDEIGEIVSFINAFMQNNLPRVKITILYGGSVSAKNAADILQIPKIQGVLVGGASLKIDEFTTIAGYS